jgi:integrative and conjugative element protein (TIGR02256 family)
MDERFWVARQVHTEMCQLAQYSVPLETGGMLIGYVADNGEAVVTGVIGPGPNARHRRYSFLPDADYQQDKLTAWHTATNGRETYLGDWHTHPSGGTELSLKDKRTLKRIASERSSQIEKPFMVILDGAKNWEMRAVRLVGWEVGIIFNRYLLQTLSPYYYLCRFPTG